MLRVSEVYPSFQGEGPNTGKPTVFIRFAGCNLKCPGWPCDTPQAIDPKIYTKEQVHYTAIDLIAKAREFEVDNYCLTGGEVFLQSTQDLESLVTGLRRIHTTVEVFTNGTRPISTRVRNLVDNFILDWKLPGSGEYPFRGADQGNLIGNLHDLREYDAIKFTVKDRADYEEAVKRWSSLHFDGVVYCGVVWGALSESRLAEWMLEDKLPWRLNVQLHKYVFGAETRYT